MSHENPEIEDIFPRKEVMARNGGTTQDGACENFWAGGFEFIENHDPNNLEEEILEDWEDIPIDEEEGEEP